MAQYSNDLAAEDPIFNATRSSLAQHCYPAPDHYASTLYTTSPSSSSLDSPSPRGHYLTSQTPPTKGHRRKEPNHVPRPRNCFILFRSRYIDMHQGEHRLQQNLSRRAGLAWKNMSDYDKHPFVQMANDEKALHALQHPGYRYSPNRTKQARKIKKIRNSEPLPGAYSPLPVASPSYPLPLPNVIPPSICLDYPYAGNGASAYTGFNQPFHPILEPASSGIEYMSPSLVRPALDQDFTATSSSFTDHYATHPNYNQFLSPENEARFIHDLLVLEEMSSIVLPSGFGS